jgi:hypothetical protein
MVDPAAHPAEWICRAIRGMIGSKIISRGAAQKPGSCSVRPIAEPRNQPLKQASTDLGEMQFDAELRLRHPGRRLSRLRPGQPPVRMKHNTPSGEAPLLHRCICPLTAAGCVKRVCADLAVIDVTERGLSGPRWCRG